MKKMEFTTIFSSEIKPLIPEEKDKYLAMASLMDVADFIPDIDVEKNIDLLPIAFNACVINRVNKNDDVVDSVTALAMAEHFVNKPINIEHDRHRVIGTILTVGFSEFGTDKKMSAEEVEKVQGPFNITLGGVLWRVVSSELTDIVEEASDPTSEFYQKISASWELGFSEYEPVLLEIGEKNLENCVLAGEDNSKEEVLKELRALGGTGEYKGKKVYRKVYGEVVPLGIGLTENPAAEVVGVATETNKKEEILEVEEVDSGENNLKNNTPIENNSSHFKEINVIENKDSTMEINSIKDINEETLKEVSASSVAEFIQSELEKASEEYAAQKTALEDAVKAGAEENERLQKEQTEMKEEFDKVKEALNTLEAEKLEREKLDNFNSRMSVLDDEYVLEDEERKVIASDITEMNDEEFSAYSEKLSVLLKSKSKAAVAEKQEEAVASAEEAKAEEPKAETKEETVSSEETSEEQVVEEIVDQAEEQEQEIPLTTQADEPTVYDKYKGAFDIDNFDIKL